MLLGVLLVETAGIQPASASPLQTVLHTEPKIILRFNLATANRQADDKRESPYV